MRVLGFLFIPLRTLIQFSLVNIRVMKWMLGEFRTFSSFIFHLLQGFLSLVRQIKEVPKHRIFFSQSNGIIALKTLK